MRILTLSHHGDVYPLARRLAGEGHSVKYFLYKPDGGSRTVGDDDGLHHTQSWRPDVEGADLIIADSPYFSSKGAAIPNGKPVIGYAIGMDALYRDRGNIFFIHGVPTMPTGSWDSEHAVWGFFNKSDWVPPFLTKFGIRSRGADAAGSVILSELKGVLSALEYIGPLQAAYTVRRKATYLIDLLPDFGYGVLMKVCRDVGLPISEFLEGVADGAVQELPFLERRPWWRFWRRG
jgi:hypothetical protein